MMLHNKTWVQTGDETKITATVTKGKVVEKESKEVSKEAVVASTNTENNSYILSNEEN